MIGQNIYDEIHRAFMNEEKSQMMIFRKSHHDLSSAPIKHKEHTKEKNVFIEAEHVYTE